eukprot:gene7272-9914_t
MSIIGIDFGSHHSSLCIWYEEKNETEVIADDLGSRTIPCAVAFRGDEIITGQAAISQQHKNPSNTFDDIRSLLLDPNVLTVRIPVLDKEITIQELASHFFRNIHNQIKQQVGKVVRDAVLSIPFVLEESIKKRFLEAAQAGGIRIKSFILDSTAALLASGLDNTLLPPSMTLIVDIGWSRTDLSIYQISNGLFFPIISTQLPETSGRVFVNALADHCAKDFLRKSKVPCSDNSKSMVRLKRECEMAMKALSTGTEATIDIDSLCEGIDYSSKISRARFEDLLTIPFLQLKNGINSILSTSQLVPSNITQVCLTGGPSAMPRISIAIKTIFPEATYLKGKFESSETQCIGAVLHGKYLLQQSLIDNAPTASPITPVITSRVLLGTSVKGSDYLEVLPINTVLPSTVTIPATIPAGQPNGFLTVALGPKEKSDPIIVVGEVVFPVTKGATDEAIAVSINLHVSLEGSINIEVTQTNTSIIIGSLTIPV